MVNQVYQLMAPRQIGVLFKNISLTGEEVIVRPQYLSICAADQRYFTGNRDESTLKKKLPMALIHEAWGTVVFDQTGEFPIGTKVLLIPNTPTDTDEFIAENYLRSSKFRASGFDGFMQEYVPMQRDRIVPFTDILPEVAAICELISVSLHSIRTFLNNSHGRREKIGVWGDGNLGYITSLLLTTLLPDADIYLFGKGSEKMQYFSFVSETFHINDIPDSVSIDHAFECVGGAKSENAIQQIIDHINPEGTIMLMGVSENKIPIETRMVLEKGLRLMGRSRSGRTDFTETARLLMDHPDLQNNLKKIIREVIPVRSMKDMVFAFEEDIHQAFKTVMKWEI